MDVQVWLGVLLAVVGGTLLAVIVLAVYQVALDLDLLRFAKIGLIVGIAVFPLAGALAWFIWVWLGRPGSAAISKTGSNGLRALYL